MSVALALPMEANQKEQSQHKHNDKPEIKYAGHRGRY